MRRILRENGLSLLLVTMFLLFWMGQSLAGQAEYNAEQESLGKLESRTVPASLLCGTATAEPLLREGE